MLGTYDDQGNWAPTTGGDLYYLDRVLHPTFVVSAGPVVPGEPSNDSVELIAWRIGDYAEDGTPELEWGTEPHLVLYQRASGNGGHLTFAPRETGAGKLLQRGDGYLHLGHDLGDHLRLLVALHRYLGEHFAQSNFAAEYAAEWSFLAETGILADARLVPCPRYGPASLLTAADGS